MNNFNPGSDITTDGIRVQVTPEYIQGQSQPGESHYFFKYKVTVTNTGRVGVHLLARKWIIIDADGAQEEITGEGVIGFTPFIEPGNSFEYESFCPLATPWGTMEGHYKMKKSTGESLQVEIGRFYLCGPAYA